MKLRTQPRWRGSAVAAVAGVLTLAACGGGGGGNGGAGNVADEVVVAIPGDIDNFDPHSNQLNIYAYAIRSLVFSSLVEYDEDLNIQPDLAEYEVNDDATVFTFSLDPEAVFHDGTPVDAEAVIGSLERAAGKQDSVWSPRLADVAGYEAPDEHTVVITLNKPNAAFLAGIIDIAIVAPSNVDEVDTAPVGSGPYTFVSWEANQQIELERFDDYFGERPPTKTIVEKPITDQQVALNNLYSGSVDIVAGASAATIGQVDAGRAEVVEPSASNSLALIEFNSSGKLADPRLRQALAYALDKDAVREIAYGGRGTSISTPLPESSWAHVAQEGYPYDLDTAKSLLAEAGATNLSFTLEIPSGYPEAEQTARVWQSSLAEIGVTMTPNTTELSQWLDTYVARSYEATWNIFNVGGDPHSFFDLIMTPHLGDDYPNQQVRDLVAAGISTPDQEARAQSYAELQRILVEDLPVMVVQATPVASVVAKGVTGYAVNPLGWPLLAGAAVTG